MSVTFNERSLRERGYIFQDSSWLSEVRIVITVDLKEITHCG